MGKISFIHLGRLSKTRTDDHHWTRDLTELSSEQREAKALQQNHTTASAPGSRRG